MSGRAALRAAMGARDANHADITKAYTDLYCLVWDCSKLGGGYPDLTVRISTKRGHVINLVEVKTTDGRLRPSQERFLRDWGCASIVIVQTEADVFDHVARVRAAP
jgi:hypothetical protein